MAQVNRKANYDNKRNALMNDATFSLEEIEDVLNSSLQDNGQISSFLIMSAACGDYSMGREFLLNYTISRLNKKCLYNCKQKSAD